MVQDFVHQQYYDHCFPDSLCTSSTDRKEDAFQKHRGGRSFFLLPSYEVDQTTGFFRRESFQNNVTLLFVGQDFSICTTMPQWNRAFQVFFTYTLINSHERFDFPKLGTRFPDVPADVFPLFFGGGLKMPPQKRWGTQLQVSFLSPML